MAYEKHAGVSILVTPVVEVLPPHINSFFFSNNYIIESLNDLT